MLIETLPFALAAAFFPAGLAAVVWALSGPAGLCRGLIYLAGAATGTVGSGLVILVLLHGSGVDSRRHPGIVAAAEVVAGVVLVLFAVALVKHRLNGRASPVGKAFSSPFRRTGLVAVFFLGVIMWTPSFAYLAALELIAAADVGVAREALNLAVVDAIILVTVEGALVVYSVRRGWASRNLELAHVWFQAHGWPVATIIAFGGGVYLLSRGLLELV
jgi:hypothetical protein